MAIQLRRGAYADFDPTKMVPAEVGVVTSGDPNTDDGKAAYVAFSAGNAKRIATVEDIATDLLEATDDAVEQATARAEAAAESVEASAAQIATNTTDIADLKAAVGDLSELETTDQSSLVGAINEADTTANSASTSASTANTNIGTLSNLTTTAKDNLVNAINEVDTEASDLKSDFVLEMDEIPDTVQSYAFVDGTVSQITHNRSGVAVRTDVFTYATNTITEVRTLNTGESLTIVTNLQTLETAVTYATA